MRPIDKDALLQVFRSGNPEVLWHSTAIINTIEAEGEMLPEAYNSPIEEMIEQQQQAWDGGYIQGVYDALKALGNTDLFESILKERGLEKTRLAMWLRSET